MFKWLFDWYPRKGYRKPAIVLDFDGVIHRYSSGWKGATVIPDPPVAGAMDFLCFAVKHFTVHILSSRSHQWGGRRAMKRYIRKYLGNDEVFDLLKFPIFKPAALVTLDDRAIRFTGEWPELQDFYEKPWYK